MHGVVLVVPRITRGLSGGSICGVKPGVVGGLQLLQDEGILASEKV